MSIAALFRFGRHGGRLGQLLTHVIEVPEVGTLLAKIIAKFIHYPRRTVAGSIHVRLVIQYRSARHLAQAAALASNGQ